MNTKLLLAITIIAIVLTALCVSASAQDSGDYWYTRALGLAGDGHYKEAISAFDSALQLSPDNAGAWAGRANALGSLAISEKNEDQLKESLDNYDKAIDLYDEAIKKDPQDANAWYYKGMALKNKVVTMQSGIDLGMNVDKQGISGYIDESFNAFNKATEISPKFVAAWRNKGNVLYIMGKYNDSIQAYDNAIETDPKYMLAWYNKGLSLYELCRYNDSIQAYDTAMKIGPEHAEIWFNNGKALAGVGNYDAAVKAYDNALNLKPSLAAAWYYKGIAFDKLNFDIGAQAAFGKAASMGYTNSSKLFGVKFDI
ncbi:MAG: tetratricopeptide repeat protein [Methanotrichaceae archaeon]